ncbi:MAG: HAMP domain-containing sensor histidine kinase [Desulfomicrobiaceae bacterium]
MRPLPELFAWARGVQGRLIAVIVGPPLVPVLLALGCALVWGVGVVHHAHQEVVRQRATTVARVVEQWVRQTLEVAQVVPVESMRAWGVLAVGRVDDAGEVHFQGGVLAPEAALAAARDVLVHQGPLVAAPLQTQPVAGVVVGARRGDGLHWVYLEANALARWLDLARQKREHVVLQVSGGRVERGDAPQEGWEMARVGVPGLPWQVEVAAPQEWGLFVERWLGLFLAAVLVAGGALVVGVALRTSSAVTRLLAQYHTEQESLREALSRAELLAQLGTMAAGFAHEINNPLQVMKSEHAYMRMLLEQLRAVCPDASGPGEELLESMSQLEGQIQRCSRITHAILGFGRLSSGAESRVVDLCRFVPEVVSTFHSMAEGMGAQLESSALPEPVMVRLDPAKLQQVLANLIVNALHAVEGRGPQSRVTVRVEVAEHGEETCIVVEDNGCGIAPEHQEAIFTPFFTTKAPDRGTGLGLPICHALVQAMGGRIDFSSELGRGTRFTVTLPRLPLIRS